MPAKRSSVVMQSWLTTMICHSDRLMSLWKETVETITARSYRYGDNQVANFKENYLSQYYTVEQVLVPSESLMQLYDQATDLRFRHFFNKYGSGSRV